MSGNPRGSLGALLFGDWGRSQKKNISVKNSVGCGWFFTRLKNTWFCQKVMQSQESVWEMVWLFCGGIVWNDWKNCLIERSLVFFFFNCVLCNEEIKACNHLFWVCSFAQAIWLRAPFWNDFRLPNQLNYIDAMEAALQKLSTFEFWFSLYSLLDDMELNK